MRGCWKRCGDFDERGGYPRDAAHRRARLRDVRFVDRYPFDRSVDGRDAARPEDWVNDALYLPQTRFKFRELISLGLIDALRATTDASGLYSFWDYQAGAWQKNNGIRIDHLLLSPQAADKLQSVTIDKEMRARDKASDHTPVRIDLAA